MKNMLYVFMILYNTLQFFDVYGIDYYHNAHTKSLQKYNEQAISRSHYYPFSTSIKLDTHNAKDTNEKCLKNNTKNRILNSPLSDIFITIKNEKTIINKQMYEYIIKATDKTIDYNLIKIYNTIYYNMGCQNTNKVEFIQYFSEVYNVNLERIKNLQTDITSHCFMLYLHKYYLSMYDIGENSQEHFNSLSQMYNDITPYVTIKFDKEMFSLKSIVNALNALSKIYQKIFKIISEDKIITNIDKFIKVNELVNNQFFYILNIKNSNANSESLEDGIVVNILHTEVLSEINQYLCEYYSHKLNQQCLKHVNHKSNVTRAYSQSSKYLNINFDKENKNIALMVDYLSLKNIDINKKKYEDLGAIVTEFFVLIKNLTFFDKNFFKNYQDYEFDMKFLVRFYKNIYKENPILVQNLIDVFDKIKSLSSFAINTYKVLKNTILDHIPYQYIMSYTDVLELYEIYANKSNSVRYHNISKLFNAYKDVIPIEKQIFWENI